MPARDGSVELTRTGKWVGLIGAKLGPVYYVLALVQVAGIFYYRNQIATVRVGMEHRLKYLIEYG